MFMFGLNGGLGTTETATEVESDEDARSSSAGEAVLARRGPIGREI